MVQQDILEINGNFENTRPFLGAVGGQLMQICLALQGIAFLPTERSDQEDEKKDENKEDNKEEKKSEKSLNDLTKNPNLLLVMLHYIKDMKNESL